jgi:hypothetical protein
MWIIEVMGRLKPDPLDTVYAPRRLCGWSCGDETPTRRRDDDRNWRRREVGAAFRRASSNSIACSNVPTPD